MTKPTPIYNVHEPLYKFKSLADSDDYEIIPLIKVRGRIMSHKVLFRLFT